MQFRPAVEVRIGRLRDDLDRNVDALRSDPAPAARSRKIVDDALATDETFYGINTGFGALARERIEPDAL